METSNLVEVASKDDRNIAALTHAGGILFGFIPALIVYLLKKAVAPPGWCSRAKKH